MTHPRADWTIERYEEELDRLLYLEADMDPTQFALLQAMLEKEIHQRFSPTTLDLRGHDTEVDPSQ